jgi:1,4-alpha-glucan branching enzyme
MWWLERYHLDGLRVDGVASMLYLDYARKAGEWIPNVYGGKENIEAVRFLRELNTTLYREHPDTQCIAEESTAWPQVTRPVDAGGLGFGMKWNMGWMHDTLRYLRQDPIHRKYHHNMGWMHDTLRYLRQDPIHRKYHHGELTFSLVYAFTENFVLALSHDEVVHGKGSLFTKMPGDAWQKFANLRLLYGYMWTHPGKKLLFMGGEFGQASEWNHERELDWEPSRQPGPEGVQRWVADLNRTYRQESALYSRDFSAGGFEWIDHGDADASVLSYLRRGEGGSTLAVVCNFTPVVRYGYRMGVPNGGYWRELLNSDAEHYCGSGQGNLGGLEALAKPAHGRSHSLSLVLPPLSVLVLKPEETA